MAQAPTNKTRSGYLRSGLPIRGPNKIQDAGQDDIRIIDRKAGTNDPGVTGEPGKAFKGRESTKHGAGKF